jgi:hypothetical protein
MRTNGILPETGWLSRNAGWNLLEVPRSLNTWMGDNLARNLALRGIVGSILTGTYYGSELLVLEDYHLAELEQTFQGYRVGTEANPTLQFIVNIRRKIFDSQYKTKEDRYYSSEEFRNAHLEQKFIAGLTLSEHLLHSRGLSLYSVATFSCPRNVIASRASSTSFPDKRKYLRITFVPCSQPKNTHICQ